MFIACDRILISIIVDCYRLAALISSKLLQLMHSRNIFRVPPDYTGLAIKYTNFRHVCDLELNGRVSVDYKNEQVLRVLTQTLLKEYFELDVEFAPGSLIPALPLRLNYILWLEDLFPELKSKQLRGIDIGCGSSCIYSLLASKKNRWRMFGLESHELNVTYAKENIVRNQLQEYVTIFNQTDKTLIFKDFFDSPVCDKEVFHFCLCNPPFYNASLADPFFGKTRNPQRRAPPHNAHTGCAEELACEGGEVKFVRRIIEESILYKERVRIFTTMLGHKQSFSEILQFLEKSGVENFTSTLFRQGNTTRWGIAWSFCDKFSSTKKTDVSV